ncbi:hypothetical protein [Chitinophaga varians]|uniref:hypothetical protein n=1 Tax=Chitinophaga varians TaxID=2202339 RepID=UPI00165EF8C1|nr:hypothetical protein [Chitinophaga varians]MBC9912992.1 hypothetical protein [Chitinophaga varians]
MKLAAEPEEVNPLLKEWSGAKAHIQAYHASLGRLAISLDHPVNKAMCYFVAAGCCRMKGAFHFDSAHLVVTREEDADAGFFTFLYIILIINILKYLSKIRIEKLQNLHSFYGFSLSISCFC